MTIPVAHAKNLVVIFDFTPQPIHQKILLDVPSKYIQNPTAFHYLHCCHSGLGWNIWILSFEQGRIIESFPGLGREVTHADSSVLELAHTGSQELTGKFSAMLQDSWHHGDSINLTMVGIFIIWILANIINQGSPLHAPYPTLVIWVFNIYQHTIACADLYYRKVILVMWFSTGVYVCEDALASLKELFPPYICLPAWTH